MFTSDQLYYMIGDVAISFLLYKQSIACAIMIISLKYGSYHKDVLLS